MKCKVSSCERNAFVAYGDSWVCGEHMVMLLDKEKERKNKQVEDIEI